MLNQQTVEALSELRLQGMTEAYRTQEQQTDIHDLSFDERFGLIVDHELIYRKNRRLARLLRDARLRVNACPEDIDYRQPRGLDRAVLRGLFTCRWISTHDNVLISGSTGVGKTFICCALANAACRQGFSARYYRVSRLLADVALSRGDGSYASLVKKLMKTNLLILDDWGLAPLTQVESREILEIVDDRTQVASTVVSSQLPVEDWHSAIGDPTIADAVLDRLVHNAHKLVLKGESMRKVRAEAVANQSVLEPNPPQADR
ncbi:MAG: ATP-binding protein [Chloroflexi bacterium]|nr:ATP-binding protein [Chloroflexota bacterium]